MRKWFRSASSAFGSLSLPSFPSAQHSGAVRAVSVEGNDLRRGEGVPGAAQHTGHLLCPHNRACGWRRLGGGGA